MSPWLSSFEWSAASSSVGDCRLTCAGASMRRLPIKSGVGIMSVVVVVVLVASSLWVVVVGLVQFTLLVIQVVGDGGGG